MTDAPEQEPDGWPPGCGGLPAGCPECIGLYRAAVGPNAPTCMACGEKHWAYERCPSAPAADGAYDADGMIDGGRSGSPHESSDPDQTDQP